MKRVLETAINCGSILCSESRLWLEMLYRKIGGRAKIRNPYFGECKRDIPVDVFIMFSSLLSNPVVWISSRNQIAISQGIEKAQSSH